MIRRLRDDMHMTGDVRRYKVVMTRGSGDDSVASQHALAHRLNTPVVCGSCGRTATPATHNVGDCEWYRERQGARERVGR